MKLTRVVVTAGIAVSAAGTAMAQINVDAPIHSSYGSCPSCDLSNKRLNGMKLENANFAGSIFNNSNLSGGRFHGADLTGAHFRKALLYGFQADTVKMSGAVLEDATLTQSSITNSVMHMVDLRRANMTRGNFSKNDFRAANLTAAKAVNVDFSGSNFEGAKLDDSNLQDAVLTGSNFKQASFGQAVMLGSQMQGVDLSGADLSSVLGLSQVQLDTTCGDVDTQLPDGLFLPFCLEADETGQDTELVETPAAISKKDKRPKNKAAKKGKRSNPNQDTPILGFDRGR